MSGVDWLLYVLVVACAGVGLAYGLTTRRLVLAEGAGSARMQEIAGAIQEGAMAYLNRQYMTIAAVGAVVFLVLWLFLGFHVAFGFMLGAPMVACYPLVPLFQNQALGVALLSYNGRLYWGFNADWDVLPDLHELVTAVDHETEALGTADPLHS